MIFAITVFIIAILAFGVPLLYPFILQYFIRKKGLKAKPHSNLDEMVYEPNLSIVIPVYNEEKVIGRRIRNIYESAYPKNKMEVIVVDSGSTDNTYQEARNYGGNDVCIIREESRNGKAHAINLALRKCTGEIVILTDGPTLYDKNTVKELVRTFEDPSVGGASVKYLIPNFDTSATTQSENLMWKYKDKIRILESKLYSTSYLSGEACAFRRVLISDVAEDTLADDSNIAFQIITKGYRSVVSEFSYFSEKSPSQSEDYFKVKVRRALGGLQEIIRYKTLIFNRKYGTFGLIIMPHRFYMEFLVPILSLIGVALLIPLFCEVVHYINNWAAVILALGLFLFIFKFRFAALTYISTQLILLRGLVLLLRKKKNVKWVQSRTTRQI